MSYHLNDYIIQFSDEERRKFKVCQYQTLATKTLKIEWIVLTDINIFDKINKYLMHKN